MPVGDIPRIIESAHAHTTYNMGNMANALGNVAGTTGGFNFGNAAVQPNLGVQRAAAMLGEPTGLLMPRAPVGGLKAIIDKHFPEPEQEQPMAAPIRRIVQVFIADPDENVPLDKSLLYTGNQKLTDATDQELYFEIDIKTILEKHNAMRKELVNKKVKERIEYLEPARVRDLRMSVITVASF